MKDRPILYVKAGCPWCQEAQVFFDQHGVEVDVRDVNRDRSAMNRMVEVSGQTLTPTFEFGDFVVADFDVDEFTAELNEFPEVRMQLGIGDNED
ncbi:MAG: glutaredoxin family protein [Puniceicoccaceae bacterium]